MATLADLFASSQAPNAPTQLLAPKVAYQRPGGFKKVAGSILDILAGMGGRQMGYTTGINQQEQAYNQAMEKQQFQNVFRNFVENPNDPMVQANLAEVNPDAYLKVAPQNKVVGDRVINMSPLGGTPKVLVDSPDKTDPFGRLLELRKAYPEGSPEQKFIDNKLAKEGYTAPGNPLAAAGLANVGGVLGKVVDGQFVPMQDFRQKPGAGGGQKLSAFERREALIRARLGDAAADEFMATGKVTGSGGKVSTALGQLDTIVNNLETAYSVLDTEGGAIKEKGGIGSNLANTLAATDMGGVAARIGGSRAQTQRDVIKGQQAGLISALKTVTGKSAGELNSIPELALALRQATDPSVGLEANRTALQFIREAYLDGTRPQPSARPKPAPKGGVTFRGYTFPNQAAADAFKRKAGL